MLTQGSRWPSQRGATGLENSLVQDSLDSIGSWTSAWKLVLTPLIGIGEASADVEIAEPFRLSRLGVVVPGSVDASNFTSSSCVSVNGCNDVCDPNRSVESASGKAFPLVAAAFGLKKPLRLCCPFAEAVGPAVEDPDFTRLNDLEVVFSGNDLLLLAAAVEGLVAAIEEAADSNEGIFSSCLTGDVETTTEEVDRKESPPIAHPSKELGVLGSSKVGPSMLVLDSVVSVGLRVNISRMLCRRSNSGISFPDRGKVSFSEYSLIRCPSRNVPLGFITSLTSTSLSSITIRSFMVAKTGQ